MITPTANLDAGNTLHRYVPYVLKAMNNISRPTLSRIRKAGDAPPAIVINNVEYITDNMWLDYIKERRRTGQIEAEERRVKEAERTTAGADASVEARSRRDARA